MEQIGLENRLYDKNLVIKFKNQTKCSHDYINHLKYNIKNLLVVLETSFNITYVDIYGFTILSSDNRIIRLDTITNTLSDLLIYSQHNDNINNRFTVNFNDIVKIGNIIRTVQIIDTFK